MISEHELAVVYSQDNLVESEIHNATVSQCLAISGSNARMFVIPTSYTELLV
jgi:hypothetical protein